MLCAGAIEVFDLLVRQEELCYPSSLILLIVFRVVLLLCQLVLGPLL